jgi:hypothetical protein
MLTVPIAVISDWPTPNYDDPEEKNKLDLWIISGIFLSLAATCVCIRLWARIVIRRWFGLDDFFIVLAFVCRRFSIDRYSS